MKKLLFTLTSLILGLFLHLFLNRYLSYDGMGPQLLLLFVVAAGFLLGPLMGEVLGFSWGLMMDAMGASFFGLQSLLYALAGYTAGKLNRRVASERPTAQLVIGLVTTIYYFLGSFFIREILDIGGAPPTWPLLLLGTFFNVILVIAVFWIMEWWIYAWRMVQEQV